MTLTEQSLSRLAERVSQSAFDGSRLRVVLLMDLHDGIQQQFLTAYEHVCEQMAAVPGHISDQLCQSIENPAQWLITSEWESAEPFLAWVNSDEHVDMVRPLSACVRDTHSLRYTILRETGSGPEAAPAPVGLRLQAAPRIGDGIVRHALTFTVRPGSEAKVAEILAGYQSPQARVDDTTSLCRTSLFMHGNRVVRAVEVRGDLMSALRHVARQPEVRAVEEAINPYLEQDRDLTDAESARMFFMRAALPAVHHVRPHSAEPGGLPPADGDEPGVRRHALYYPARPGCGMALARLLARQDAAAAHDPGHPVYAATIFQRDDVVVRLVDVRGSLEADPARALGVHGPRKAAVLTRLLDHGALGSDGRVDGPADVARLLRATDMRLVTDRRAPQS
ncbi:SchA/CurD-like domain-containing protein [Streptomyces sp. NRRL S-87]|uniref:SchA/CurD-like domain-containing protein n=1 Tax=Streptomyces sp. NRRL S-87 TaxID=1463920 RepID=UPI0004C00297|nr:SchA/CurD-like domain-containing protein [Streptomyces sp. NRRL S-87]